MNHQQPAAQEPMSFEEWFAKEKLQTTFLSWEHDQMESAWNARQPAFDAQAARIAELEKRVEGIVEAGNSLVIRLGCLSDWDQQSSEWRAKTVLETAKFQIACAALTTVPRKEA